MAEPDRLEMDETDVRGIECGSSEEIKIIRLNVHKKSPSKGQIKLY